MNGVATTMFEQHADDIYGWAYRLLGRHHDALDVVQEVFLRWTRQYHEQPPTHPRGWLRRVTLNKAIDAIRATRTTNHLPDPESMATPPSSGLMEDQDRGALRADVSTALESLTDAQRSVLTAKVFDGMTFAAIADEQSLAISTVKTHYFRAVETLRSQLKERWEVDTQ